MPTDDALQPPDSSRERARREYTGLFRIADRHGSTASQRARQTHPEMLEPHGAARIVAALACGGLTTQNGESDVDDEDIIAALTLMPKVHAEVDELETLLLTVARRHGITWQTIAFGLGLGSAQAAKQRYERLERRTSGEA